MALSKELSVLASVGLHARPAAEFVKLAQQFQGSVRIDYNNQEVDGKSMIGILKLAIKQGTTFNLSLDGENEEEFMSRFEELIAKDE
ncbi:MAG: HPr family phosphocarrier protein [Proteobacteria bacterium]|nr:HPr family phosphocarrier protein [Pseudomonadota bacterium]